MTDAGQNLEYLCATRDGFLVLTFLGVLNEDNLLVLDRLLNEIPQLTARHCVLQLRDVNELNRSVIPHLIRIQEKIREKMGTLRLCSMKPAMKQWLLQEGVVRPDEFVDNLLDAWQEFTSLRRP